jgi:hypothetical protein
MWAARPASWGRKDSAIMILHPLNTPKIDVQKQVRSEMTLPSPFDL